MNSARLLKIIFVILLVVIVGEVGYYVYIQTARLPQQNTTQTSVSISPVPSIRAIPVSFDPIADELQQYYKKIKSGIIASSIVNNEYRGKITYIDTFENADPLTKTKYKVAAIDIANDKDDFKFRIRKKALEKLEVLQLLDGREKSIDFNDLKIGDQLIVKNTFTFINKNDIIHSEVISLKIIKQ